MSPGKNNENEVILRNRIEELWATGMIYYGAVPPTRPTITSSKVYREVMQRERRELYPPSAEVEMRLARDKAGLYWQCLELGKRMREKKREIEGEEFTGEKAA